MIFSSHVGLSPYFSLFLVPGIFYLISLRQESVYSFDSYSVLSVCRVPVCATVTSSDDKVFRKPSGP